MDRQTREKIKKIAGMFGYKAQHLARIVPYRAVHEKLKDLNAPEADVLEIGSGYYWKYHETFGNYTAMDYPDYDICHYVLEKEFDIIIADNVFEHLKFPARAAKHVHEMLRPGGTFINLTPFLIRYHYVPIDCTRWTETGMKYFLVEAGFEEDNIETGGWGNRAAVKANLNRFVRGGFRSLRNEKNFPLTVWAFAKK